MTRHIRTTSEGPPRGRGHYSDDGQRWWDDELGRWLPTTEDEDTLEVQLEDVGGRSWVTSLFTTLAVGGNTLFRFVGRARSHDPRWPTYEVCGDTFLVPRALPMTQPTPQPEWAPEMTSSLEELRERLVAEGWRAAGRRTTPWSYVYTRPAVEVLVGDSSGRQAEAAT